MRTKKTVILLLFFIPAAFFPACTDSRDTKGSAGGDVRTVVLLTIDTWRRDASGFLGKRQPSPTPFLDTVAAGGFTAGDAVAPVPITGPSHWSMLTGRWPWRDGAAVNGDRPVQNHSQTLAGVLGRHGWRSAGFVSCRVLDHRLGFSNGFDHFDDMVPLDGGLAWGGMPERRGDVTVAAAASWLQKEVEADECLFLWVHLFDPHYPYEASTGPLPGHQGRYLGEVAFADRQVRRLAEGLEKIGRPFDRSLWVILSDHGEALGAHGEETHGLLLHGVTTRIPLIVCGPGVPVRRSDSLAATVDVFPTILAYLDIAVPKCDGIDLLSGRIPDERAIPLESMMGARSFGISAARGLRFKEWLWEACPEDHLWNVNDDPLEENNLAKKRGDLVRRLKELRKDFSASAPIAGSKIAGNLARDLQSLGYLPGSTTAGKESVRRFVKSGGRWFQQALTLQKNRQYARADQILRKFLSRYRRSAGVWQKAGMVSVQLADFAEAERRFRKAIELDPKDPAAHLNLANVFFYKKRLPEAERAYRNVLQLDPEDLFALYNLGLLLYNQGRFNEAADSWKRYLELYPNHRNATDIRQKLQRLL